MVAFNPGYAGAQVAPRERRARVDRDRAQRRATSTSWRRRRRLSHNRYQQFNVDSRGLILNNATQDGPVRSSAARDPGQRGPGRHRRRRIILNEVVAPNRSMLNGFIE